MRECPLAAAGDLIRTGIPSTRRNTGTEYSVFLLLNAST
jgi:hypothetical protein